MKKLFSVILAGLLAFSSLPIAVADTDEQTIEVGQTISIDAPSKGDGEVAWVKFVPETTGTYYLGSSSESDPYCELYDAEKSECLTNADDDNGYNFVLEYTFTAGETYYFAICDYNGEATFDITLSAENKFPSFLVSDITVDKTITFGQTLNVTTFFEERTWIKFVPETSGTYCFYSSCGEYDDPFCELFIEEDGGLYYLDDHDDVDGALSFYLEYTYTAGETYYFGLQDFNGDTSWDVTLFKPVSITHQPTAAEPYFGISDTDAVSSYQWYKGTALDTYEITSEHAESFSYNSDSTYYNDDSGWTGLSYDAEGSPFYRYLYVDLSKLDTLSVEVSCEVDFVYLIDTETDNSTAPRESVGNTYYFNIRDTGKYVLEIQAKNADDVVTAKVYLDTYEFNKLNNQTASAITDYEAGYYYCEATLATGSTLKSSICELKTYFIAGAQNRTETKDMRFVIAFSEDYAKNTLGISENTSSINLNAMGALLVKETDYYNLSLEDGLTLDNYQTFGTAVKNVQSNYIYNGHLDSDGYYSYCVTIAGAGAEEYKSSHYVCIGYYTDTEGNTYYTEALSRAYNSAYAE